MITIENHPLGYQVKLGHDRRFYLAHNVEEAATAVKHYLGGDHEHANCPICIKLHPRNAAELKRSQSND